MTGRGRYGHQLDEPNSSTVIMQREEEEEEVFQAINYSSQRLRTLIWTNCMPFCEAIDMRPLVLALGVSLTHLDLSGHRLDIACNRRAFVDKLPMMQSLVRLFLRHTHVFFETDREGGPSEHLAETEILDSEGMCSPVCLLKAIAHCLELQELDLSGNRLGSRGTLLLAHFMPALHMLKTLSLRGASLDDTCAPVLGKLLYKCSLQKLEVAHNDFTYFGCGVLKRASENVIFEADLKWIREVGIRDWNLLRNYADPCWTGDKVLILELLEWWWEALEISSPTLQDDPDLFAACLRHHDSVGWRALRLAGESIRSNKSSVAEACAMDIRAIEYAFQNVKDDKDFIMKLVREDEHGMVLRHMGTRMKSDRDVVLAAVQKCGSSLQFASDELRGDMAIVLAAIRSSFHALVILFRAACRLSSHPPVMPRFPHTNSTICHLQHLVNYTCGIGRRLLRTSSKMILKLRLKLGTGKPLAIKRCVLDQTGATTE